MLTRPKVFLLDEPSSGLAPKIVHQVFETTKRLVSAGATVLMVEQNARAALTMSDRVYVMERGRIVLEGPSTKSPPIITFGALTSDCRSCGDV